MDNKGDVRRGSDQFVVEPVARIASQIEPLQIPRRLLLAKAVASSRTAQVAILGVSLLLVVLIATATALALA